MKNPIIVEQINGESTDWLVSRTDSNPQSVDCIHCANEQEAKKLLEWLSEPNILAQILTMGDESLCPESHTQLESALKELIEIRGIPTTIEALDECKACTNPETILKDLYDSEINFGIVSPCWDGGYTVMIGGACPYNIEQDSFEYVESGILSLEAAINTLRDQAIAIYPESVFTAKYTK